MILVLGGLVTAYTMLGGIQAVIWNDVIQFCIMFGGLAATVWIALSQRARRCDGNLGGCAQAGKMSLSAPHCDAAGNGFVDRVVLFFTQPMTCRRLCHDDPGPDGQLYQRSGDGAALSDDEIDG